MVVFDGIAPGSLIPRCHTTETMLLMVERFMRADAAMSSWATDAKRCVEFLEGKQWSAEELRKAADEDRPTLTLNKIAPLIRLVLGYHRNNRVDAKFLPTQDSSSSEAVGTVLTKVAKQISGSSSEPYVDTEVFLDGLTTGRGYYDWRLGFERNDFGEIYTRAKDPFCIRPDPDADTYDPDDPFSVGWGFVFDSRWASVDEIEFHFGRNVSTLIEPLVRSSSYKGGVPSSVMDVIYEITPWRTFAGQQDGVWNNNAWSVESYIANSVDPMRKNIRLVECQHKLRVMQRSIVDLETGDREPIPENFTPEQVMKIIAWAGEQYMARGQANPLRVEWRPRLRVRWTAMVGDIVVYDNWSPYESFTVVPFFPYWRRGKTRGAIDDLIDPQREINKRRSSQIDILTRIAHSGWMWHKDGLDEPEKEKIEVHGGAAGINLEWKGSPEMQPKRIEPGQMPAAIKELEASATLDLKEIAGINDSALGQVDRVQSGRAIEARQRQSILGIESYMDNMRRTKLLCGRKKLELIQNHYTEARIFRIQGDDGQWSNLGINVRAATGQILNDVTVGRYDVVVDETSLSATWLNAQFEELMALVEKGVLPVPMVQDILVDLSSAPQKELIKVRLNSYMQAMGMITPDQLAQALATGQPIAAQLPPPGGLGVPQKGGPQPPQESAASAGKKPPKGEAA